MFAESGPGYPPLQNGPEAEAQAPHLYLVEPVDVFAEERKAAEEVVLVNSIDFYMRSIRKYGRLNAEQEVDLAKQIEAGVLAGEQLDEVQGSYVMFDGEYIDDLRTLTVQGKQAFDQMVNCNLPLVVSIAKRYKRNEADFADLIQYGNLGLQHAVEMFDYAQGYKFSTYATRWIKRNILAALSEDKTIRIPRDVQVDINQLNNLRHDLGNELGREPSDGEVAQRSNGRFTAKKVADLTSVDWQLVSMDAVINEDAEYGDFLPDTSTASRPEDVATRLPVRAALLHVMRQVLSKEEFDTLWQRFDFGEKGKSATYDAIVAERRQEGAITNRTEVSKQQSSALDKLRQALGLVAGREWLADL